MDLDLNSIAADFVQTNLAAIADIAANHMKGARNLVRSKLQRTYKAYLDRILTRYSRGKSFFARSEAIPLYDFFVPLDLATDRLTLSYPDASDVASESAHAMLIGSGGSGKTMMMRHLLIGTIRCKAKTPIFYELRQQNAAREPLRTALLRTIQSYGLEVDDEYLELGLGAGHFSLMLDGFDELNKSLRKSIVDEIDDLARRYPQNWIVLSSRHDPDLQGWDTFTQFRIKPLDLERASELVRTLPFEDPIKHRFVEDLQSGLFVKHESFLSNPLLLSIMLLTYSDIATIPTKISIFYTQAYEALFQRHDALKSGFKRERRSALDIQDFATVFATFSLLSFDKRAFSFSEMAALDFLTKAQSICQVDFDPPAVLHDATQAVSLLIEDGMEYTFAHRSFQEYFAARFISTSASTVKADLFAALLRPCRRMQSCLCYTRSIRSRSKLTMSCRSFRTYATSPKSSDP